MDKQLAAKLAKSFTAAGLSSAALFFALNVTILSEGVYEKVYLDPVSLPTVCVGHMDRSLKVGKTFTLDKCMSLFAEDWKKHQDQLANTGFGGNEDETISSKAYKSSISGEKWDVSFANYLTRFNQIIVNHPLS